MTESRVDRLDATFRAALRASWPRHRAADDASSALAAYAGGLCGSLLTTRSTPSALEAAAQTLARLGADDVAVLCRRKAQEESGHDTLVLADLAALGIPPQLAERVASSWARQLAWSHHDFAARKRPFGVLGWMYALERAAALITPDTLDAVQALVPPGLDVTRARRVHCGAGDDAAHAAALGASAAALDPVDVEIIADAVGVVVPMLIGAAFDLAPAARLVAHGWRPLHISRHQQVRSDRAPLR